MYFPVSNTLHRQKDAFVPVHPILVAMYLCGPSVYGHGNLRLSLPG